MIEVLRGIGLAAVAILAFSALLILPGVRIADRLAGDARALVPRLILAFVTSQVIVAAIGLVLVALRAVLRAGRRVHRRGLLP